MIREIDPEHPHSCDILRPCFVSDAQEREFEELVRYLVASIDETSIAHARMIAAWFSRIVGLSHDAETLLRVAAAEAHQSRERRRTAGGVKPC